MNDDPLLARFGERLDALTDRSGELEPISDTERRRRIERFKAGLEASGLDALVLEPGKTFDYVSRVPWGRSERLFALVITRDHDPFWVIPAFEAPRGREKIEANGGPVGDVLTWDEHEYAFEPLGRRLLELDSPRVAVDHQARAFVLAGLAEVPGLQVRSARDVIASVRGRKEDHEIRLLALANEITQEAIRTVAGWLEPGLSDHDVAKLMRLAQSRMGLSGVWVLSLFDDLAALPHGRAGGRVLEKGSRILVDTGGSLHGYQSDNTRSWVFDAKPDDEYRRGWDLVRRAQVAAFEAIRPGIPAGDVDRAARAVIDEGGFGTGYDAFAHRLGHGIGMEGHEDPYFDGGSQVLLEPGMTFSNEPGIYLPGRFGIRLEDCVAVGPDGAHNFGEWQAGPEFP